MNKFLALAVLLASSSLLVGGCSSNTANGAAIGSLVGAGIGKSTANHKDKRAALGAVAGGAVGAAIGAEQDRIQRERTATTTTAPAPHASGYITHTHHYPSGSITHSHEGGDYEHSHQQAYTRSAPVVYIDGYYGGPRGHRHRHHRPWRRHHHY